MTHIRLLIFALGLGGLAYWFLAPGEPQVVPSVADANAAMVAITLPGDLSDNGKTGQTIFAAKCQACHGDNATGQNGVAPPLVHKIYEPTHHADESFQRAVALGVRQHHWSFGNMPAIDGLTRGDVAMIIAYVRELQRANGIN